jgi:putative acetyltransferase
MIRWAKSRDVAGIIAEIQYRAVREGPSHYSQAQRMAWVPTPHPTEKLAARLGASRTALFAREGVDVGCMTLADGGYIDMAFILPVHQGTGVFRALFEALQAEARKRRMIRLHTHASLMAQPAFRAAGFRVIQHETIERAGETLPRAEMEKLLT